ncbi:MAG: tRNA (adenosine(37)-N6)-threonylcarbamoyltransferase complex transferase subunit TsaD [Mariprofundaceae bacterium]|nr:tRNA (adenosine(37)-N6)-threonylcarbamoyltransferase complex transferase subunit TsaD [Mariprofundaceae bacterium]
MLQEQWSIQSAAVQMAEAAILAAVVPETDEVGKIMRILGIETSCDETAVAIFEGDIASGRGSVLAERIASQIETHARFGGVVPEVASREHLSALPVMVEEVMAEAGCGWGNIDTVAVTAGPGLMGALLVGTSYARALGAVNNVPVIPVHHMEGHLLASGLSGHGLPDFPFMTLLVSGGHTMLVRVDAIGHYRIAGQTIDDAAGECFDKSARLLDLPYPGGPEISRLAEHGDAKRFKLPRPMLNRDNLNFSFSGLKTAAMYAVKNHGVLSDQDRADMAASIETAICEVLVKKSFMACRQEGVKSLVIAGGVAANRRLRSMLAEASENPGIEVHLPQARYCTDNAAMICYAAFLNQMVAMPVPAEWDVQPRWKLSSTDLP